MKQIASIGALYASSCFHWSTIYISSCLYWSNICIKFLSIEQLGLCVHHRSFDENKTNVAKLNICPEDHIFQKVREGGGGGGKGRGRWVIPHDYFYVNFVVEN